MTHFKHSRLAVLAISSAALFSFSATASAGFSGYYDVSNWSTQTLGDGYVDTSGAPDSITVVGPNDGGGFGFTDFLIQTDQAGTVSFDWSYFSVDDPDFDAGLFYSDSTGWVLLSSTSGQNGAFSAEVEGGEIIAFSVESVDRLFGPGELTIRNFDFEPVPEPGTMAVLGLGLAAAARRRRK